MFQPKKIYLNLGLVLIIVLTSAATWFLTEFIVFELNKAGDDYMRVVGEFRPEARAQATARQWEVMEIVLNSSQTYANPYTDVEITAVFNGPEGRQKTVKGFWDGGSIFRVRFTPTISGTWSYAITSSPPDAGLTQNANIDAVGPVAGSHGFIRIDNDYPSSFIFDDGTRYFMFGTTAYSIMRNAMAGNSWQNTINYLRNQGINKVRMLLYPWPGSTTYADAQPFTSEWDHNSLRVDYWQKLDEVIEYMADRDVVADMIIFCDNDRCHGTQSQDRRYTRYAIARLAAYPNVIWCMRNEYNLEPIFSQAYWNDLGGIVSNNDPWMSENSRLRPLSIHKGNSTAFDFHSSSWHSHIIIQHGIWPGTNPTYPDGWSNVSITNNLGYNMPVVNDEYGYTGMKVYCEAGEPIFDRTRNRQGMWGIYIAGGYASMGDGYDVYGNDANVYGSNWGVAGFITGDYYDCAQYDDAKRLIDFWTTRGIEYWRMSSHNELITSGSRVYALADPGREYVVYGALGGSFSVNLQANTYNYEWFNPSTGNTAETGTITASNGNRTFDPPFSNDAVLYLVASTPACTDSTPYNTCVAGNPPRYCNGSGQLIDSCGSPGNCGCPNGQACSMAGTYCETPDLLIAHYTMDTVDISGNIITDRSDNSNDAIIYGAATASGIIAEALSFDGQDDYLQISDDPTLDLGTGDFTIALWIKKANTGTRGDLITKKDINTAQPSQHDLSFLVNSADQLRLFMRGGGSAYDNLVSSMTIGPDWTHLTVVRNGTVLKFYFNGEEDSTGVSSLLDISSNGPLRIGANRVDDSGENGAPDFVFHGSIDDARLYNYALSLSDIQDLYNLAAPAICHQLTPGATIPDGYGAPWNMLSGSDEMLIETTCNTDSVDVEAGNGDPLTYIYRMGYIYKNSAWQSYDLTGANPVTSDWYAQSVSANIPMTPAELSGINYIVAYTCFWNGTEWKCGCRDSGCSTNYWQLQIFGN